MRYDQYGQLQNDGGGLLERAVEALERIAAAQEILADAVGPRCPNRRRETSIDGVLSVYTCSRRRHHRGTCDLTVLSSSRPSTEEP